MRFNQINKPIYWNADANPKYLKDSEAFYIKNREFFVNLEGGIRNGTVGSSTPLAANELACEMVMPVGETYSIGVYSSQRTNEVYVFVYNSNGVNFIYRISGDGCDIVYDGDCLSLSAAPERAVTQFRAVLKVEKTCKNWGGKQLIFCDGLNEYCIDVEASIATNSFTSYFFENCGNPCDYISYCVPRPKDCLKFEYLPRTEDDNTFPNKIIDLGFQFMYRWVYYDGRKSVWSDVSSFYYQSSKTCFVNENGYPRCMKTRLPLGNAMVEYIEIAYRNNNEDAWSLIERLKKYEQYNNSLQQWYQRKLSDEILDNNYSTEDCSFDYVFCNDKQCVALDPIDTAKVYNPHPREAQGVMMFGDNIAFYNYKKGNCPLPKDAINNFNIKLDCENESNQCEVEYAYVTVRLAVHNLGTGINMPVFVTGDNIENESVKFGALLTPVNFTDTAAKYGQEFNGINNFKVYIDGNDNSLTEMSQFLVQPHSSGLPFNQWSEEEVGVVKKFGVTNEWYFKSKLGGFFYYQKARIKVVKGTKGFLRIAGHNGSTNTSTYIVGTTNMLNYNGGYNFGNPFNPNAAINKKFEIFFDTCNGDVDLTEGFIVSDNSTGNDDALVSGFVKDKDGSEVGGALLKFNDDFFNSNPPPYAYTDFNGFYFIPTTANGKIATLRVFAEMNCSNFSIVDSNTFSSSNGINNVVNFNIQSEEYNSNYLEASVKIVDCDEQPMSGIVVSLSGNKSRSTNNLGIATFRVRQYESRNRQLTAVVIDRNGCFRADCFSDCNYCMPVLNSNTPNCFISNPSLDMGVMKINVSSNLNNYAILKSGGRYAFGFLVHGRCGKLSFVNKGDYIDIPKKCNNDIRCRIMYDLSNMQLPLDIDSISIVRTKNLNSTFVLQWVVDKVERVDGNIRITIQSLNDYNEKYFLETNTKYQYTKGDRVEFISNENGVFYCDTLNYQILSPYADLNLVGEQEQPADFFNQILIEDDGRLNDLKEGAIIELQRPQSCATEEIFYTICSDIKVENGVVLNPKGELYTFDTYLVNRKIGSNPLMTFEHHSPSDFWVSRADLFGVSDIGTAHVVNEFEDETRFGRNITISEIEDIASFGRIEKTLGDNYMGDIIAMNITDDRIILGICEHDNFVVEKADDLLRVTSNGTVAAASEDQVISNPAPKLSGRYGCQYDSIGSIYFGDGFATYADVNNHAYIIHDYSVAKEASFEKISSWTISRFQKLRNNNSIEENDLNKYRFSTGINILNKVVMLTIKQLRHSGVDNEMQDVSPNETISYRPLTDSFHGNYSFTPEGYGLLNNYSPNGVCFITIQNGLPYIHPVITSKWNEFYGIPCDTMVGIAISQYPEKVKIPVSLEIQDKMMWYVKKVTTSNDNFESEIPPIRMDFIEGKWASSFLFNKNSVGGLFGVNQVGENARGYFIKILLIRDNSEGLKYNVFDNNKRIKFDELDLIINNFALSEPSALNNFV